MNKIIHGDCLKELKKLKANSVDLLCTDPPYGYSFMGKDWDKAVPSVEIWKECLRVLKPGAFAFVMSAPRQDVLSQMIVRIGQAGFDTNYTSIYWTYACLSEDTEVLTPRGWQRWEQLRKYDTIGVYDPDRSTCKWESPTAWNAYEVAEDLYRIKSKDTDQLVSRNHRVFTSEGLRYAEHLPEQVEVVFLPHVPQHFRDIPSRDTQETPHSGNVLYDKLSSEGADTRTAQVRQASTSDERSAETASARSNARTEKLGVEGWRNLFQNAWELCRREVHTVLGAVSLYGSQGRLCYGASHSGSASNQSAATPNRSGTSYQPHSLGQSVRELGSVQNQSRPQTPRTRPPYQTTLATVTREPYHGLIYCPTVSTGVFLARRNGQIFLTGNSGFPKAANIGKMVDKRAGVEREVVGENPNKRNAHKQSGMGFDAAVGKGKLASMKLTAPATPEAKALEGSYGGFQPKPAVEVIIVAMKPLSEKTYVDQALKNGKGVTWLDDCRVPAGETLTFKHTNKTSRASGILGKSSSSRSGQEWTSTARFPANLLVSDDVLNDGRVIKSQTGSSKGAGFQNKFVGGKAEGGIELPHYADEGSYSRYFDLDKWWRNLPETTEGAVLEEKWKEFSDAHGMQLDAGWLQDLLRETLTTLVPENLDAWAKTLPFLITPKASKGEKNEGLDNFPDKRRFVMGKMSGGTPGQPNAYEGTLGKNHHPTVKPLKLMAYLITLGSRPGDTVLDPFLGSGTTALAAKNLGRNYIGIEREAEYVKIARARLKNAPPVQPSLIAAE